MDLNQSWYANAASRVEAKARHERFTHETAGGDSRHRYRTTARTSGVRIVERGTDRTSVGGMVRREQYSPPGLPDPARHASVGQESDRLPADPCSYMAP